MHNTLFFVIRSPGAIARRIGMFASTTIHRLVLDHVGAGTRFQWRSQVHFNGTARVGRDCYFCADVAVGTDIAGALLEIGNNVQINRRVLLDVSGGLKIGDHVLISEDAVIYTHDHGLDPRAKPTLTPKLIGSGAWIGMRVIVLASCATIGRNAVVGAGALVTHNIPENAIVAGVPARVIGWRKESDT